MKIAFDVDDTIWKIRIREVDGKKIGDQVPDYDIIQVLRWFVQNGDDVFVWSGGGVDYAQHIVDKLGLTELVKVLPKVRLYDDSNPYEIDIAFDDSETKLAKVDVLVKRPAYE